MQVGVHLPEEQGPAHLFLAQYYMKMGSFKEAEAHAHKCTNFVKASATCRDNFNDHYQFYLLSVLVIEFQPFVDKGGR